MNEAFAATKGAGPAMNDANSLNAYHRARAIAERPRASERRLLTEITAAMRAAEAAGARGPALAPCLHRNREAWATLSAACAAGGNALPDTLRAGVISLAIFVDRHTSAVIAGKASIEALVEINLSVIDGLAGESLAA
jgi:flagellar protein FlaF